MSAKTERRNKIKFRVRNKISGTTERPRMSVFRSNKQIYVQIIDDLNGRTLAAASSLGMEKMAKKEQAAKVGELIAGVVAVLGAVSIDLPVRTCAVPRELVPLLVLVIAFLVYLILHAVLIGTLIRILIVADSRLYRVAAAVYLQQRQVKVLL